MAPTSSFRTDMDSDFFPGRLAASGSDSDFGFAFNDRNFSDRVLRIEIIPDLPETKSDADACISITEWARNRKRRREEIKKDNGSFLFFFYVLKAKKKKKKSFYSMVILLIYLLLHEIRNLRFTQRAKGEILSIERI